MQKDLNSIKEVVKEVTRDVQEISKRVKELEGDNKELKAQLEYKSYVIAEIYEYNYRNYLKQNGGHIGRSSRKD